MKHHMQKTLGNTHVILQQQYMHRNTACIHDLICIHIYLLYHLTAI